MRLLEIRAEKIRREMDRGRGGETVCPFPVSLLPPFARFSHDRGDAPSLQEDLEPEHASPAAPGDFIFMQVRPSKDDEFGPNLSERLLLAFGLRSPLAFEIMRFSGRVCLQFIAWKPDAPGVLHQLCAHYPHAEVSMLSDPLRSRVPHRLFARCYRLRDSHLFLLRTEEAAESYVALMGILTNLSAAESGVFQVLFQPVRDPWRENILAVASDPWDPSRSAFIDLPDLPRKARRKVDKPLFAVSVRLAASSVELLQRIEDCFLPQFEGDDNALVPIWQEYPQEAIVARESRTPGMIVNAEELGCLVHLPDPRTVPHLEPATLRARAPALATLDPLVIFGANRYQNEQTPVGIGADWMTRHVAVFGATGYGKTTLLKHFFADLMAQGLGLAFLDPAGDAAEEVLDLVPERRIQDVIYLNPGDREFPPALNMLKSSEREQEMLASELMLSLKRIFRGVSEFGPRMEWITRQALRTLLASAGEKTLRDVPRLLADEGYRREVLRTVSDPDLLWFWKTRAPFSSTAIDPILGRLSAFLDRPTIRNIVSQPNRIDFHEVLRDGKILICNLSKGILGEEHSALLGSFILSKLQLATMARAEVHPHDRRLFTIAVDEFQNYAGNGSDTASIRSFLSEARKYRVSLIAATQFTSQLDRDVVTALFGNVGTLICLRCGITDAQVLQRELGIFSADDLLNLETGQALVRMGRAATAFNVDIKAAPSTSRSFRNQIVQSSREFYCRPRSLVEAGMTGSGQPAPPTPEVQLRLEPEELAFLQRVAHHPEETVTVASQALALSGSKGSRVRRKLVGAGALVEVDTCLGEKGRRAKYAMPTLEGYHSVGEKPPKGRGGPVHKHFVQIVARWAEERGYQVSVEHQVENGWVDVHLERDGETTAVELSVTSTVEDEMKNLKKCLEARYSKVVMLFVDAKVAQGLRDLAAKQLSDMERNKLAIGVLNDFHRLI